MKTVDDKVVVITGAASGIGRALAVDVARRGALLAISDVDETGLAETVDLVKAAGAREVRSDRVDVSDRAAMTSYAAAVAEQFGRVDVVINNAGVALAGDVEDLAYDDMDWIMGINFWGVVHGTKEFLPHLIASGDGHLVNISSLFGLISIPGQSMYNASKYAVRGFTEALREEMLVAGHPVGVTAVHPGGIKTAIARNGRYSDREDGVESARIFDEKMATMSPERAAEIIVTKGILGGKARVLVGLDAHALHQFARITGSRYQNVVASVAEAPEASEDLSSRVAGWRSSSGTRSGSRCRSGVTGRTGTSPDGGWAATSRATGSASQPAPGWCGQDATCARSTTRSGWCRDRPTRWAARSWRRSTGHRRTSGCTST